MATLSFKATAAEAARIRRNALRERRTVSEFLRVRALGNEAKRAPVSAYRIVRSRITGLPVMLGPSVAPKVASEDIRELLADFP